jgi:hypothetical protein
MKERIKHCNVCKLDFVTMYRVQYKHPKEWVFNPKYQIKHELTSTISLSLLLNEIKIYLTFYTF